MQLRFFRIPAHDTGGFAEELNGFLRSHRIVNVEREFCNNSDGAYWAVCVEYLASVSGGAGPSGGGKDKIDYREKLSPEDFAVFSALREVRKELAERDGVPVYAVFTNEQIAAMVTTKADSLAALQKIDGVGASRLEKYGERIVAALHGERTRPACSVPHPAEPGVWPCFLGCRLGWVVAEASQAALKIVAARSGGGFWPLATGGDLVAKWKKVPGRSASAHSSYRSRRNRSPVAGNCPAARRLPRHLGGSRVRMSPPAASRPRAATHNRA
jgi:hypothetical protein